MPVYIFNVVVNTSISAALVTLAILLVRRVFRGRLPTVFAYLMWGIVLFRFIVPFSVPAQFSGLGFTGRRSYPVGPGGIAATVQYLEPGEPVLTNPASTEAVLWQVCAWLWIAGAMALLVWGLVRYLHTYRAADTAFIIRDNSVLLECSRKTGLHRVPALYRSGQFSSPVIVGIFRPRVVLPDSLDLSDEFRLRHILIHECVHLRRFDHIIKALFSLLLCMHWFNPLVWLACSLFDVDVEASCDEQSLALLGEANRAGYARSLIDLSATQQSFLRRRIAFSESNLRLRVMNVIRYRPLSRLKRILVVCLLVLIGIVTVTNPLHAPDIYIPTKHPVSAMAVGWMEDATDELTQVLIQGNPEGLLSLSRRSDHYYLSLYEWLYNTPLPVKSHVLYPQSEELAFCYLTLEDGAQYVAVIQEGDLISLQSKVEFEAEQLVDSEDEAVRFIQNLHRFGILQRIETPAELPRPAVAMLCIDEVYRDKLAAGEIAPGQMYLAPEEIAQAARAYFGLQDFSYTFDPELYDESRQAYLYDPDRGGQFDARVVSLEHGESETIVTAIVYSDPLHLIPESKIIYTLQRRKDVVF